MANNLGSLVVSLGLDAAQFTRGMSKSEYEAKKTSDRLKAEFGSLAKYVAGLGLGAALVGAVRSTADYQDGLSKLARQAGETTEEFSKLSYASRQADVDDQQLAKGLREIGKDALEGGKKLATMGISATDASGRVKTSTQLFHEFADAVAGMETPQQRAAAAAELLGEKAGPQMVSLLSGGSAGLKALGDEAERFGRVVTTEAGIAAEQFNDNITKMQEQASGLANIVGNEVLPVLTRLTESFIAADGGGASFAATLGGAVRTSLEATIVLGRNVAYVFETVGDTLGAYAAVSGRLLAGDIAGAKAVGEAYREAGAARRAALDRGDKAILNPIIYGADDQSAAEARRLGIGADRKVVQYNPISPPKTPKLKAAKSAKAVAEKNQGDPLGDFARPYLDRVKEMESAASRLYASVLTPIEKLANREAEIAALRQGFYISDETAIRARMDAQDEYEASITKTVEKVKENTQESIDQAKRLGDAFSSTFDNAFREGQSFGDLLKKLAYDAINIQLLTPAAQKAGNALGSIVSGIFGGARAGGGSVSAGTTYLVGEKGPELWTAPANGNIIPNNALGSMGGPSITFAPVIDARGSQAGVENLIDAKLRQAEARFRATIVPTVMAAANRGGGAARALGRA